MTASATTERGEGGRLSGGVAGVMLAALTAGAGLGAYLSWIKLRLEYDPTYVSSCNYGSLMNCDAVQTSIQSEIFGYPLALFAVVVYAALALGVVVAWRSEKLGRAIHAGLALVGVGLVVHSAWLAWVSTAVIGAYCLYCMSMYAVNVVVLVAAALSYRKRYGRAFDPAAVFGSPGAPAVAIGLLVLTAAISLPAFDRIKSQTAADRIAQVEAELKALESAAPVVVAPEAEASPEVAAAPEAAPDTPADTPAAAPKPAAAPALVVKPIGDVITRKGRSYYEVPVEEGDPVMGPADAPVTIVEFADFECGYCRKLTENMAPLKKKYAGKVRWVFKHFPMDNGCNKVMKGTQHPRACYAAKASNCANEQGKFWEMHDALYARQHQLEHADLRKRAKEVGLDMEAFDTCLGREGDDPLITRHSLQGRVARIAGTPRMYINGHLVPGVHATEVLEYYIQAALKKAKTDAAAAPAVAEVVVEAPAEGAMIEAKKKGGSFWMDAYEASIDGSGRALSKPGEVPALVSWFEAKAACDKAGKRLCTEEEWVSACTGEPAIDDDVSGFYADDAVEGRMFPYGLFHQGGICHDQEREKGGKAVATGSFGKCRTPSGIFDLSGNVAEWTGLVEADAAQTGSYFAAGQKAACRGRRTRFGPGYRNETTGFRCCADQAVSGVVGEAVEVDDRAVVGQAAPEFEVKSSKGKTLNGKFFKNKLTVVAFFASWCGPCRRELPELQKLWVEHHKAGFQVLAIGVDTDEQASRDFIDLLNVDYTVAFDPKAVSMGQFGVKAMPTSFLVDGEGKVVHRMVGSGVQTIEELTTKVASMLAP